MEPPPRFRLIKQPLSSYRDDSNIVYYLPESKQTLMLPIAACGILSKLSAAFPASIGLDSLYDLNSTKQMRLTVKKIVNVFSDIGLTEEVE